ncbi:TonB-dependent receptor plug domain-containing protein [Aureitalea marina]|uniref:TonB-dependent receptor plug domain-containing protein n=1 Tax=Aureitalea marina TaxID=930804 RepID=A0A2S7KNF0_9FLAO|nr:TonB-dependent receptor plug domain-containing protein [Aureitalea marina]PQB04083.1 hypothetical protein BST85_03590 [Aureitalea marina]
MKKIDLLKKMLVVLVLACCTNALAQTPTKNVSLLWDSSYGMIQKDIDKEFEFLKSYFNQNPDITVNLVVFSNSIVQRETIPISGGNWEDLKLKLREIIYDGSASYEGLFNTRSEQIILVSDGKVNTDKLPNSFNRPVFAITTIPDSNIDGLRDLAISSGGALFDLSLSAKDGMQVFGDSDVPLDLVKIREATARPQQQSLGEVLISTKVEGSREEDMINTGNIVQDKRSLGYAIETIGSDEIREQDITIEQAVTGQFSNIDIKSDQNLSQFISRGKNMTILGDQTGLIVVDGVPVESSVNALTGINAPSNGPGTNIDKTILNNVSAFDPANVESITVLKGLAATNKYGTLGRNGVILITTKTATFRKAAQSDSPVVVGTTATYSGDVLSEASLPDTDYMQALKETSDVNEAFQVYLRYREKYGWSPDYFLHTASYFQSWNNTDLVKRVLSNISELPISDTSILLAQAYKYQEFGMKDEAVRVYERILELQPNQLQHYRNLALAYSESGYPEKALLLMDRMDKGHFTEILGYNGLRNTLDVEFKNLVNQQKGRLNTTYVDQKYKQNVRYRTRVVFEWNHFDTQFDLQIINPQKRYFTWSHTQTDEGLRMKQEIQQGYGLEEFFMTNADQGLWTFNLNYLGKARGDNNLPAYLKITTYQYYGQPQQTKKIRVITLDEINQNKNILKVSI